MTELDLELVPEPPAAPAVQAARHRRALVAGLGGGRAHDAAVAARQPCVERRLRASDTAVPAFLQELGALTASGTPPADAGRGGGGPWRTDPQASADGPAPGAAIGEAGRLAGAVRLPPRLDDALVIPAGAVLRGYLRCRALLLAGDVVGNVHCTAGPVVIRSGASLKGRLVAAGDVYVSGTVGDGAGGVVISTRGKLTLAPGGRVDGDVRSGRLDVHEGALLQGVARPSED